MADRSVKTWLGYGVIGLVVTLCAGGWAVIMGNAGSSADGIKGISASTIAYQVQSDRAVQFTFQLAKPKDRLLTCTAQAVATDGSVVGSQQVQVRRGQSASTQVIVISTSARATTAEIKDCTLS